MPRHVNWAGPNGGLAQNTNFKLSLTLLCVEPKYNPFGPDYEF